MRLHQLLQAAADRLRAAGVDTPEGDARVLLAAVMGCDRAQLISDSQQEISRHHAQRFEHIVARRAGREPVARILGQREFWGM
ncbi:MAG: protein-(glutamine-N5) methyltransferase, release factor-specific, partial [Alphaproteobacteria bacterium]|nr:protein-(glutamine-N5) methyltransferase, release factor-specific [Alphaproteobacteria bacterium]